MMCPQLVLCLLQMTQPTATAAWWYESCSRRRVASAGKTALVWGTQQYHQGRFEKALLNFKTALHQCTQAQDLVGIGKSLNGLSAVYLKTQAYERSLAYSQASVEVLGTTIARQDYALAMYQLGVSHLKLQNLSQAEQYLEQALALYQRLQDPVNEDRVLLHLGQLYAQRQEFMFALACYESVLDNLLECTSQENTQDLMVDVLSLIKQLCEETHCTELAIVPQQDDIDRYLASGHLQELSQLFRHLGQFFECQQQYSLALKCYSQSFEAVPMVHQMA